MNEYEIGNYGIFQDGVSSIQTLNESLTTNMDILNQCKTELNNDAIFMGPICDSCVEGFEKANLKVTNLGTNFTTMANYLMDASTTYKAGDEAAAVKLLHLSNGVVSSSTSSGVVTGKANQDAIYSYLSSQGFNDAAISGILANIQHESNFNPNALGDGGTSYGICQWHSGRWTRLKNYCSQNGLDSTTLDGQLSFLVWELQNNYPSVYNKIISVPNTAQGAYDAAYEWTVHYEIPANKESSGNRRGNTAVNNYWSTYGGSQSTTTV